MSSGPFAWGPPEIATLQVSALSQLIESRLKDSPDLRKRSDLRESAYVPRKRHVLTDPAEIRKKHAIEMGFNWLTGQMLPAPLEPWTGPAGSERIYNQLMRRGPSRLQDYSGPDLAVIEWLTDEELAAIVPGDDGMRIVPLSDGKASEQRKYPGAPVSDERAKIGRQLRGNLEGIVLSALFNLSSGRTVRRGRRRTGGLHAADGIPITGAQVAAEANAIKARRRDLDEYRWASLSRVREIIRKLIRGGLIEEVRPPRPVREKRSWRTMARVIRRMVSVPGEPPPLYGTG